MKYGDNLDTDREAATSVLGVWNVRKGAAYVMLAILQFLNEPSKQAH